MELSGPELTADCARCAALCCAAFAFEPSESFAIHKDAGAPCPHLDGASRCAIHATRAERGFSGCVQYDCHGAGQRVTQILFAGRSWRSDPALLAPMLAAFEIVRRAHELLLLLKEARRFDLSLEDARRIDAFEAAINALADEAERKPNGAALAACDREVRDFLPSLARYVAPRA